MECNIAKTLRGVPSPLKKGVKRFMPVPISTVLDYFINLQNGIVTSFENEGGDTFLRDEWQLDEGGGGLSRYIENGNIFERGAVLFSHVKGNTLPPSASAHRSELAGRAWEAMGVSLVVHPHNPFIPTCHKIGRAHV